MMKTRRFVSLALSLVLLLSLTATAFAVPDNYVYRKPLYSNPDGDLYLGWLTKDGRPNNPLLNDGFAYAFAKLDVETCSIWVYGQAYEYYKDGELQGWGSDKLTKAEEADGWFADGALKHLAVFKYTGKPGYIDMVGFTDVYHYGRKGAFMQITEPGRYFAAVCDFTGCYTVYQKDFVVTQEMLDAYAEKLAAEAAAEEEVEEVEEVTE